ncbi:MAG: phage/plasmid primase, P4 family [Oscillospiraceae bacterium]
MYEKIPEELKALPCWICWQGVPDDESGKLRKIPVNARDGTAAKSNDPSTWTDFNTAAAASLNFSGIGFVFDGKSGYFGVDLDGIGDSLEQFMKGVTDNIAGEFIHTLQSYTEISQSGHGIHIICRGSLPAGGRRKNSVEMYESGRYFIMTGNAITDYGITDCTDSIKALHEKYIGGGSAPVTKKPSAVTPSSGSISNGSIGELLEKARRSKQGDVFSDLMAGNFENHYKSHSEADIALCNMLAFWLGRDAGAIDSAFRSSGLMRDKWDRKQSGSTYGALTIQKAIADCMAVYGEKSTPVENYSITISPGGDPHVETEEGEEVRLYSMDDTGNAERMFVNYGSRLRYSYVEKTWYYWDERRWCKDITGTIDRVADDSLDVMRRELEIYKQIDLKKPPQEGKSSMENLFQRHIKTSRSSKAKTAMKKELQHRVPIVLGQFDRDKYVLNTPTGIIDLKEGKLLPHDIEKYITKLTGTGLSESDCPQWKVFLNTIFNGDAEMIRYIQKAVGYSLSGSTNEQCVFFLYGTGRNGKSTFLDTIRAMMGDYAANAQPETIMVSQKSSGGARSDIARLKGARFVTTVEPNEGMRLDEGLIKQLTGGDPVTARFQYSQEFEFVPEFKIWMATNHKPIIRGTDTGIWRRIHLVPFTAAIPESKVDRNLPYKLRKELPSILKWAVDGYALYKSEGLRMPAAVLNAVDDYRREMDVISAFLSACCTVGKGAEQSSVLYAVYCKWASDNNEYKMSHTRFTTELLKKDGISKERRRDGIVITGINIQDYCRNQ